MICFCAFFPESWKKTLFGSHHLIIYQDGMFYLRDSQHSMKPTCWCPNPCAFGCQTLAMDRHHSKLTIWRACDDSILAKRQPVKLIMLDHFGQFQSRKAIHFEDMTRWKRCQKEHTIVSETSLKYQQRPKKKQPCLFLLAFSGWKGFFVCIHPGRLASAIFTIASTDMGWPLMRSWWNNVKVGKQKKGMCPQKKRATWFGIQIIVLFNEKYQGRNLLLLLEVSNWKGLLLEILFSDSCTTSGGVLYLVNSSKLKGEIPSCSSLSSPFLPAPFDHQSHPSWRLVRRLPIHRIVETTTFVGCRLPLAIFETLRIRKQTSYSCTSCKRILHKLI